MWKTGSDALKRRHFLLALAQKQSFANAAKLRARLCIHSLVRFYQWSVFVSIHIDTSAHTWRERLEVAEREEVEDNDLLNARWVIRTWYERSIIINNQLLFDDNVVVRYRNRHVFVYLLFGWTDELCVYFVHIGKTTMKRKGKQWINLGANGFELLSATKLRAEQKQNSIVSKVRSRKVVNYWNETRILVDRLGPRCGKRQKQHRKCLNCFQFNSNNSRGAQKRSGIWPMNQHQLASHLQCGTECGLKMWLSGS